MFLPLVSGALQVGAFRAADGTQTVIAVNATDTAQLFTDALHGRL